MKFLPKGKEGEHVSFREPKLLNNESHYNLLESVGVSVGFIFFFFLFFGGRERDDVNFPIVVLEREEPSNLSTHSRKSCHGMFIADNII